MSLTQWLSWPGTTRDLGCSLQIGSIWRRVCRWRSLPAAIRVPSLPITIYSYAGSPFQDWIELAWAGALLITLAVLLLNILARSLLRGGK